MTPEDVPDGPLVVDTDVVSYLHSQSGPHAEFEPLLAGHLLAVSFATYAEVLAMGRNAGWGERRMAALRATLARYVVVPSSADVAEMWAQTWPKVRGHLHGDGANDVWTAAVAVAHRPNLPLVTNNLNDYRSIKAHLPQLGLIHPRL